MSAYCMQEFVNLYRFGGSDALAKEVLAAQQVNATQFLSRAFFFAQTCGKLVPEAHVLCALALQKQNNFLQALYHWDKLVQNFPKDTYWISIAASNAINLKPSFPQAEWFLTRWLAQLSSFFLSPPELSLLHQLESQGIHLQGSCGIHQESLYAWLWLPKSEKITINLSAKGLALNLSSIPTKSTQSHSLYTIKAPLPKTSKPYSIAISDTSGRHVVNSPLIVSQTTAALPAKNRKTSHSPILHILIPCYDDRRATMACLATVFKSQKLSKTPSEVVVIWDHGPSKELLADLRSLANLGKIVLRENPQNLGFLASVNATLASISTGDIVLLNADTLVSGDWIDRMAFWLAKPDCGTVTALGSDAELVSYPSFTERSRVTKCAMLRLIDACAKELSPELALQEIPVGVGFCMGISRKALAKVVGLDGEFLFNGYGEEVDFCLRVREAGLKNYAALNIFVAHLGGRSFGSRKKALATQNNAALFDRYEDYKEEYEDFVLADPLKEAKECLARSLCRHLQETGILKVRPFLDQKLPDIFLQESKPVDDFPWQEDEPAKETLPFQGKAAEGHLFLGERSNALSATLRIKSELPFAEMHFSLPKDSELLSQTLKDCHFSGLEDNTFLRQVLAHAQKEGDPYGLGKLIAALDLAKLPESPEACDLTLLPWTPKAAQDEHAYLVLAPRRLSSFQTLTGLAHTHPNWLFFVYELPAFWGLPHTPPNICAASQYGAEIFRTCTGVLVPACVDRPSRLVYKKWLCEHHLTHLPCHNLEEIHD
ncbi:MAG: glycosyltransferase [Desulfovibrio sp.]|nr:glycosyltransferase [Desulfovibrio sp.]